MYSECVRLKDVTGWEKGEKLLFHRLDWSVRQGERVLVMGDSGSGREELFDMITGSRKAQEGTVTVQGRLAVVRERFPLLEGLALKEYPALILEGMGKKWGQEKIISFLKEHALWERREYDSRYLTIGEQCRLQFAMAEALEPDVIIMGPCWKYLRGEETERFWDHVKGRLEGTGMSFIGFSDVLFMETGQPEFFGQGLFSHIYILKDGKLTESEKGWIL